MKKVIVQGILILVCFLACFTLLKQINWVKVFNIEKASDTTEKKLGTLFWDMIRKTEKENYNQGIRNPVDSIIQRICIKNGILYSSIKMHIIEKDEVNAFALPDGHLVIYTGLIKEAKNAEELSGVIGHEMAHIQLNHVMKKLVKEVGLSVLLSMTAGGGGEIARETLKFISSTAFDRDMEKDADLQSVDYLNNARINPKPFADFLYRMASDESEFSKYLIWSSTHPESKERASYILEYCKSDAIVYKKPISSSTWDRLQSNLKANSSMKN